MSAITTTIADSKLRPAREDYLIEYADKHGTCSETMRSVTRQTVQDWITAHMLPGQEFHIYPISDLPDISDDFQAPSDFEDFPPEYEREASRADQQHQAGKEAA